MSRTRVLYEHPLAYAASPVSITYKGRLGEHDLVYFSNLFPGNRGIFQIDLESGGVRQLREVTSTGRHVWIGLAVEDDLFMAACDSAGTSPGVYRLRIDHAAATFEVEEQLSDSFEGIPLHGPNDVITGALPSANSRLVLTLGAPPSKGYGNGGVVVVCQLADDDLCAGPGYEHNAYTALRVAAAAAALAAVVCAALCLRCCWRRLFRRRREKRD